MSELENIKYQALDQKYYLPVFHRFPVTFDHGKGAHLWDVDGNKYIDVLAGIAVNNVGHCHPKVAKAISEQVEKIIHVSNFYLSKPQAQLAKKLTELSGLNRVFFSNSGAESVEVAFKIARKYAHSVGRGGTIISFDGCFHGRTLATIATGKKSMQRGFEPIPHGFEKLPFNDIETVRQKADKNVAAVIIELIQGEGGINVAGRSFIHELRDLCEERNIALIFDEIQTGIGRTGEWFAKDHFGVQPDIMVLAKALGAGTPIAAVLSNEKVSSSVEFGDQGTTFGGNPLVCAASLACLDIIEEDDLLVQARDKGQWIRSRVEDIDDSSIKEVRGLGLMIGVEFDFDTKPLVRDMFNKGVLANATAENVLRLVPPLNIEYEDLEFVLKVLKESLKLVKENV